MCFNASFIHHKQNVTWGLLENFCRKFVFLVVKKHQYENPRYLENVREILKLNGYTIQSSVCSPEITLLCQ